MAAGHVNENALWAPISVWMRSFHHVTFYVEFLRSVMGAYVHQRQFWRLWLTLQVPQNNRFYKQKQWLWMDNGRMKKCHRRILVVAKTSGSWTCILFFPTFHLRLCDSKWWQILSSHSALSPVQVSLRMVPTIVIAHRFCASWDTGVSYGWCLY